MSENEIISMENQNQTRKLLSLTQGLVQIFAEVIVLFGDDNIEKEQGGQYYMTIVSLLLILFDDYVFIFLLFAAAVCKLSPLTQGLVKIFLVLTMLLGNNNSDNERGGKYNTEIVPV